MAFYWLLRRFSCDSIRAVDAPAGRRCCSRGGVSLIFVGFAV
ncbi:hypothetical protein RSSM_02267 [Rhodopirellula sallentina SM41]|uniref:Uncharacterized protein n=1 Tax=Rhodopirellula sallentina SM41 TaxID=1263870 RepID=M5U4X2_9BACT|nr:hypothetical protein RSSM_02267 [Rhodopirellula sallentina SM41]